MRYPEVSSLDAALRAARVSCGVVTYPRGGTFGPRLQRSVQLIFVHDGSARVTIDEDEIQVPRGFGALLLPWTREHFQFSRTSETTHSWIHYWSAAGDDSLLALLDGATRVRPVSPALARLTQGLLAHPAASSRTTTLRAYEILYRYVEEGAVEAGRPQTLEDARTYVEQHLSEPLVVDRLAAAVAVSRSHLFRLFRAHLGLSPAEYIWQQRIQLAVELIEETGLSVAAVADRAGFRTPKHLSRRVREATGMSPTMLRKASLGASFRIGAT